MILKKIIIDGKVVYEPISYEEALAYPNKEDLIGYLTIVKKYVPNASLRGID